MISINCSKLSMNLSSTKYFSINSNSVHNSSKNISNALMIVSLCNYYLVIFLKIRFLNTNLLSFIIP